MAWKPDYATAAELAEYVRTGTGEVADDAQLALAVHAASRAVDRFTHRQFGQSDAVEPRFYSARWSAYRDTWLVRIDDVMVAPDEVATNAGGDVWSVVPNPRLLDANAPAEGRPWTRLQLPSTVDAVPPDGVRVTARFGWVAVPDTIKEATLLQGSRLLARRDSPFGVAGSPDVGSELRLLARLDPDVEVMVAAYRRTAKQTG
ncbi:hypothetical protein [Amycolatopsis sp. Poz14]|uniref:hypothetical protein n=1 Tax=Amycolatopsis sp. Poz14 TaxID=1447705 RepID=UPI001EE95D9E|nr:hypothetical protein [Amycolatopsis sp. Poz14]MCG3757374.1 phage gp6-like head-tail connector protein [Amycolatopsis sp. Poz14]